MVNLTEKPVALIAFILALLISAFPSMQRSVLLLPILKQTSINSIDASNLLMGTADACELKVTTGASNHHLFYAEAMQSLSSDDLCSAQSSLLAIDASSRRPLVQHWLGLISSATGQSESSLEYFGNAESVDFFENQTKTKVIAGDDAAAIKSADVAVGLGSQSPEFYYWYGRALNRSGNPAQAAEAYETGLRFEPDNLGLLIETANIAFFENDELDVAESKITQVLNLDPTFGDAHLLLGQIESRNGNYDEALQSFEEAIRVKPSLIYAHIGTASIYLEQNRLASAQKSIESALAVSPMHHYSNWVMGEYWLEYEGNPQAAIPYFETALGQRPDQIQYQKSVVEASMAAGLCPPADLSALTDVQLGEMLQSCTQSPN